MRDDDAEARLSSLVQSPNDDNVSAEQVASACIAATEILQKRHSLFSGPLGGDIVAAARRLDRGGTEARVQMPLFGTPIAVKDNIAVRGRTMRAGMASWTRYSQQDAAVVGLLRKAGGLIFGGAKMHELAFGPTGANSHDGGVQHPFVGGRICGGSSSGAAAAVALGVCRAGVGTDTGGSVRIPAALCGLVGYKPSFDRVSRRGVLPLSPTLDHVGFIAGNVADVQAVVGAIFVAERVEITGPVRLAVVADSAEGLDADVAAEWRGALGRLELRGCKIAEVAGPNRDDVVQASTVIMCYEAFHLYAGLLADDSLGHDVRERLEYGATVSRREYLAGLRYQREARAKLGSILQSYDGIIGPTVPVVAPKVAEAGEARIRANLVRNTRIYNLTGDPAVTIPVGKRPLGVGLQLGMRSGADGDLMEMAAWISKELEQG